MTYVRFVTQTIDRDSGRRLGLFQAVYDLVDANLLLSYELDELQQLRKWFSDKLDAPIRFAASQKSGAASVAICWFKSSATEHISRMYAICRILNEHGVPTEVLKSGRPGYVVFEDEFQVAAIPFADTVT